MTTERAYEGSELDLFLAARNWKSYWSRKIRPHIGQTVLEVGAGFGSNTPYLHGEAHARWVCLEPDAALVARIPERLREYSWASGIETRIGTLQDIPEAEKFDTLLYIDVLEHIEDDRAEMERALAHLAPGGRIVVLSPAHPWLFTPFDRAIGHFRRYTKATLRDCTPAGARLLELYYLDAAGLLASSANRLLLQQSMPTPAQIGLWDRWLVTNSLWLDPLLGFQLGKTVIGVWTK
ncbi:MAG TPA: class I SAM-dependent methyltransferase [Candidatus Methylacidiphilales bacterium]|jgi:2-polyprenyl-3-methyl-5-hydroxy-6-metoxy-1,4-benzoquinol methylase|nr:class I SAM-dependent methyltransferase [Candidatus Methylacidiphilales bacterium]